MVGAALGKLGFEILPATGGLQAFQRLAVRRPDLILLDLLLPEMDGLRDAEVILMDLKTTSSHHLHK